MNKIYSIVLYFLDKEEINFEENILAGLLVISILFTGCGKKPEGKINFSEEFIIEGTHEFQIKGNKMTIQVDGWEGFDSVKLKKAD